jgi:pimeloyl-ACP methyl ester carboxylesterase
MATLPLLALPGLLCDERLWRAQAAALGADRTWTSFALVPERSMAELAAAALARVPAERFALAGLSMGGYLALEIVRRAPERVAGLALLDTSARPDTAEASAARRSAIAQSASDFDGVVAALLPRLVHPSRLDDRALTDLVRAMAASVGRERYVGQQEAIMGRADSRPTLAAIRCPTLVLCGRDDALTPLALHEEMHAGIAGSRLVVVERCGHMSTLERPEEVSGAMREWLAAVDRSPARQA